MLDTLLAVPGRLYVVATLLPLLAFALLLLAGMVRWLCWPYRDAKGLGASLFKLLGGDRPHRIGGYVVLAAMAGSALIGVKCLMQFLDEAAPFHVSDHHDSEEHARAKAAFDARWAERMDWFRLGAY